MTESKHSPAPWRLYGDIGNMVGADNMHSADCQCAHSPAANAAHIVRCVNAFPVMLEALKGVYNNLYWRNPNYMETWATAKAAIQEAEKEIQV